MMSFISRSLKPKKFDSLRWTESTVIPGVRFAIREPSLANRIELTRTLHELTIRNEFLAAGRELQQLELALAEMLVQKTLVEWGLVAVEGLRVDNRIPTAGSLIEVGPEDLVAEIAAGIRARCGLTEEERKN